jgi:mono/diheme cytochrome c family protein
MRGRELQQLTVRLKPVKFLLGIVVGIVLVAAVGLIYFKFGTLPVAVADPAFPFEAAIVHVPLDARIQREAPKTVPIAADEQAFLAGAHIYREQCAFCHGLKGHNSTIAANMYPDAPPLWKVHHNGGVVGVSDDPPGETYWKVANGIRLTGMPSYKKTLSETQMWEVSLLLANADKPLPAGVDAVLTQPLLLDISGIDASANTSPSSAK